MKYNFVNIISYLSRLDFQIVDDQDNQYIGIILFVF